MAHAAAAADGAQRAGCHSAPAPPSCAGGCSLSVSRPQPARSRAAPDWEHAGTLKGSRVDRAVMVGGPGGLTTLQAGAGWEGRQRVDGRASCSNISFCLLLSCGSIYNKDCRQGGSGPQPKGRKVGSAGSLAACAASWQLLPCGSCDVERRQQQHLQLSRGQQQRVSAPSAILQHWHIQEHTP